MGTPRLDYATPPPPKSTTKRSSWVAGAGALVVMYFLALGLCVPKFGSRPGQARLAMAMTDVSMLGSAIELFSDDTGRVPTDAEGLSVLFNPPADAWHWRGPYVRSIPNDPWGRGYVYHATRPCGGHPYTLLSVGPDGVEGTADDVVNK